MFVALRVSECAATPCGRPNTVSTIEKWIHKIPEKFQNVIIDYYVIMPDRVHLVLFILNDWDDHISMFEYGFSECEGVTVSVDAGELKVAGGEKASVPLKLAYDPVWLKDEKCEFRLLVKPFEYAPVREGKLVGKALLLSEGKVIEEVPVITCGSVAVNHAPPKAEEKGLFSDFYQKFIDFFRGELIGR